MNWKKQTWLLGLTACLLIMFGCGSLHVLFSTSLAMPDDLGLDVTITQLRQNAQEYAISYSGPKHNPSALLFIPKSSPYDLRLAVGWHQVTSVEELETQYRKIHRLSPLRAKVKAVVRPEVDSPTEDDVLAFLYTAGYASLRVGEDGKNGTTYVLRPVPEQFNPDYHDRRPFFGWGVGY